MLDASILFFNQKKKVAYILLRKLAVKNDFL